MPPDWLVLLLSWPFRVITGLSFMLILFDLCSCQHRAQAVQRQAVSRELCGAPTEPIRRSWSTEMRLHEVDEGAHLGRRQMARRVERVERKALAVPIRQNLDQRAL